MTANLLECPRYKIEDRKTIVSRVLDALLANPDCRYSTRGGWVKLTADEQANWEARELLAGIKRSFPVTCDTPSPCTPPLPEASPEPS